MKIAKLFFFSLLSAFLILSIIMVIKEEVIQQKEKKEFEGLQQMITPPQPSQAADSITPEKSSADIQRVHKRDLAKLYEANPDCIGWIYIEGTNVDYPVMHTPQNPQKYLRCNFEGKYSQSGVPFLDARCDPQRGTRIIYGHNMKNGTQFSNLQKYVDTTFRNAHSTIEFETGDGVHLFEVTEVRQTDIYDELYKKLPEDDDRLILSTCYGSAKSGRLLIIAKEIEQ